MADYTNKRGIFSLLDVRERQAAGVWSTREDVWLSPSSFGKISPFGYFTGGQQNNKSTVTRLDFSNDSAGVSVRGPLTTSIGGRRGLSSSSHGYVIGGFPGPSFSTVDRIDYGNDTATASPRGPLSRARKAMPGASTNADFGYDAGGYDFEIPGYTSIIERIDYSNDTATATPKGPLSSVRYGAGATGNQSFGYFAGGETPTIVSTIDRVDYSNDTATASPKGPLSVAKRRGDATGNASFGYHAGGDAPGPNFYSTIERVDYSNDTATAVAKGPLTSPGRYGLAATGSASSGYFAGGTPSGPLSKIDRIDYSNDTATATTIGNMPFTVLFGSAFSPTEQGNPNPTIFPASSPRENIAPQGTDFGYFTVGDVQNSTAINRIDYSNDTAAAVAKGPLSVAKYATDGTGNASFGYFGGGYGNNPVGGISNVDRIDYGNDTATAVAKGPLSVARYSSGPTSTSSFGYFMGGFVQPPNAYSTVDRIDYSNDTATATPKGPLSENRYTMGATGNQNFGYVGGGYVSGPVSTVDRIDYSNDTATAVAKGPLSAARAYLGATGNSSFGYFGGGFSPNKTTVDRIDYSNDTATAPAKGPLSLARRALAGTGNASFGYFAGGSSKTTVDRVDYSNDTATAAAKGPLTAGTVYNAASSSRANAIPLKGPGILEVPVAFAPFIATQPQVGYNTGYFSGGLQPSNSPSFPSTVEYSSVARIDFSNDTTTVPARGSLTDVRYSHAGTGNANFGYHGGGAPYSPSTSAWKTSIERIDYSNDTATASLKGQLSLGRNNQGATGNVNFGYYAGGTSPTRSTVDRIDYSNDTATAAAKGPLSLARYSLSSTGNQSFGYNIGGYNFPAPVYIRSTIDRIDYSNDTATAVAKGPLSVQRDKTGSTGNADFGYAAGGYNVVPGGNNWVSLIDRIDYSNDTATASPKGPLSRTRGFGCATGDSSFGYFGGGEGNNNENLSALDRLDYSNDTATTVDKGPLSYSLRNSAASSSLANANPPFSPSIANYAAGTLATPNTGYFGGGNPGNKALINRIDYSNDTATAVAKGPLSVARNQLAAMSSGSHGYFAGGYPSPAKSTIDRVDYLNDTATAVVKGPLSQAVYRLAGTDTKDFGYLAAGEGPASSPSELSSVDRVDYSNDTATAVAKGPLAAKRYKHAATGNQSFGYYAGGRAPTKSSIDRLDYASDTTTGLIRGPLTATNQQFAATGNADFGYFGGGGGPGGNSGLSTVDRVDYSNDTITATTKGPLNVGRHLLAATGDASFGYFAGGRPGPNKSLIDRVDYSNDTATASPKGPLTAAVYESAGTSARSNGFVSIGPSVVSNAAAMVAAVGPTNFGYFGGGFPPANVSIIQRIDYSNDTETASPKGPLSVARYSMGATGNSFFGYMAGGESAPGAKSTVDRIEYANDTATAVAKGPLSEARPDLNATGNSNFGYFGGGSGYPAPAYATSLIDRVDYSNDTATASPKGNLSVVRQGAGATGTQSFGYFAGGFSGPSTTSLTDRVDYSNDTATAVLKGNLSSAKFATGATGNSSFGYFAGASTYLTTVDRLDYSSDTTAMSPKGPLSTARGSMGATGSASFGYFAGGQTTGGPRISTIDRVDYSNDTATASPKGLLTANLSVLGASSAGANALPQ